MVGQVAHHGCRTGHHAGTNIEIFHLRVQLGGLIHSTDNISVQCFSLHIIRLNVLTEAGLSDTRHLDKMLTNIPLTELC